MAAIAQYLAVSYPDVVADKRKPENQWAGNALLTYFEKMGFIEKRSFGPTIEIPVDYRRNPGGGFLTTELQSLSLTKTEVIVAASYTPAELDEPMVWSFRDEVTNNTKTQKVDFVDALINNGLESHDNRIEEAFFSATSTNGFHSLMILIPSAGQGSPGGIPAATETWWRNPFDSYLADGSDIEAVFTGLYNAASKGSGGTTVTSLLISGSDTNALYEGNLQAQQRWVDAKEADGGFKTIAFKGARYGFSQFGSDEVYFLNNKCVKLLVSKDAFRDRKPTERIPGQPGYFSDIYSALQLVVSNKSRVAVAYVAP